MVKLNVKLTSLAVTVLHIDPVLTPSPGTEDFRHDDTTHPLACMAETFFSNLGTYGFGGKDFEDMAEKFEAACTSDHLRYSCLVVLSLLSLPFYQCLLNSKKVVVSKNKHCSFKYCDNGHLLHARRRSYLGEPAVAGKHVCAV